MHSAPWQPTFAPRLATGSAVVGEHGRCRGDRSARVRTQRTSACWTSGAIFGRTRGHGGGGGRRAGMARAGVHCRAQPWGRCRTNARGAISLPRRGHRAVGHPRQSCARELSAAVSARGCGRGTSIRGVAEAAVAASRRPSRDEHGAARRLRPRTRFSRSTNTGARTAGGQARSAHEHGGHSAGKTVRTATGQGWLYPLSSVVPSRRARPTGAEQVRAHDSCRDPTGRRRFAFRSAARRGTHVARISSDRSCRTNGAIHARSNSRCNSRSNSRCNS